MKKICSRCGKEREMLSWENTCWACSKLNALEQTQAAIRAAEHDEMVDTRSDDYIICPYCGAALETDVGYADFPEIYEEGDHELECEECGKTFVLNTIVSYSWETEKKDGDGDD
ncbi:MAG: hypothetical protein NC401_13900 [Ruminococcus sp.]|nr:hypothetical protein [Ruminococcus sp.]